MFGSMKTGTLEGPLCLLVRNNATGSSALLKSSVDVTVKDGCVWSPFRLDQCNTSYDSECCLSPISCQLGASEVSIFESIDIR